MVAIRSIKGFLFVLILAVTSMIFTPLFLGPTLILSWLKPRWFRFINDSLVTVWLEYMLDVKIILTGEKPARYENSIIIMNHRCRLDWMFFWCVMARSSELALRNEKILMKRELKYIPGPGE
ncbi:hypothetical protein pdam_00006483 [Pocillopora damicornis]|uniref:Phospholipid/glycerol acyltransferase domain-containing protein n=1 Tax=Pocillopora damicornis TaxID=46731 RepID=A0A3M6THV4_POCDA|nr:hypothetical protein pdam_00006483 [Pocillopora damicornis]